MSVPFVHSNFERRENDHYPTIDKRCVYSFLEHIQPSRLVVDVCSPNGSGIVDTLAMMGFNAICCPDAFMDGLRCEWVVTNPPYKRGLVDRIINRQIERVEAGQVYGVAMLLRSGFDHAKTRAVMFDHPLYFGQIKMRFRPWWSENRSKQPIHNYVWHLWQWACSSLDPVVLYSLGDKYREA